MAVVNSKRKAAFRTALLSWFDEHGRKTLPWKVDDPYRVWLSEIMLQQTQVSTVLPAYEKFLERFPTVDTLAAAGEDAVLAAWSGLGYYSRARNLHRAAQAVVAAGAWPVAASDWEALPGIGRSTAGALAAFCSGGKEKGVILDGNVRRVICRHEGVQFEKLTAAVEENLWAVAEALTPKARCADYGQAVMDLGAGPCSPRNPQCKKCPLQGSCKAFASGGPESYPKKKKPAEATGTAPGKKKARKTLSWTLLTDGEQVLLVKNSEPSGVWRNLYLPEEAEPKGCGRRCEVQLADLEHSFSHFDATIKRTIRLASPQELAEQANPEAGRRLFPLGAPIVEAGIPSPLERTLAELFELSKTKFKEA